MNEEMLTRRRGGRGAIPHVARNQGSWGDHPPRSPRLRITASFVVCLLVVLPSCNLARMHARKCENHLERNCYQAISAGTETEPRFAWHRDTGKEKLLLLHGYSGTGSLQWSRTVRLLRDDYDCIVPDLLSHGRSAKWDTTHHGLSLDDQAAHVIAILDSLGIRQPIAVVGNSYGGGVAARLAERYPQRVKKLVIYDGLVSDYSRELADSIARAHGAPGMLAVMRTPSAKDLRFGIRLSLYRDPPLPGFVLKQIYREFAEPYRPAQITLLQDLMAHEADLVGKRYDWRMPVYLIWGERDELIPNSTGLAILHRNGLPDDHWYVIPRTGHVANVERPKEFVRVLEEILAR